MFLQHILLRNSFIIIRKGIGIFHFILEWVKFDYIVATILILLGLYMGDRRINYSLKRYEARPMFRDTLFLAPSDSGV